MSRNVPNDSFDRLRRRQDTMPAMPTFFVAKTARRAVAPAVSSEVPTLTLRTFNTINRVTYYGVARHFGKRFRLFHFWPAICESVIFFLRVESISLNLSSTDLATSAIAVASHQ